MLKEYSYPGYHDNNYCHSKGQLNLSQKTRGPFQGRQTPMGATGNPCWCEFQLSTIAQAMQLNYFLYHMLSTVFISSVFYFFFYPLFLSLCLSCSHSHTHTQTQVNNTHLLLKYGGNYSLFCSQWSQVLPPNECKWKSLIAAGGEAEGKRSVTAQLALCSRKYDCSIK